MAAPVVASVSPSQGPASGGTTVTVTGTGFTGATTVRFGAKLATSFTVDSSTQITAVSPSGTGSVNVTVTTGQGTSIQQVPFTYVSAPSAPSLTGLTPAQGPVSGGTTVTLTGTGFTGATAVTFGGAAATSFTVNSATQITATTPPHTTGAATVTVTTPSGTSNALTFTYLAAPSLTGLTPTQGPVAGGTTLTLTGTGFTGATAVTFSGAAATSFTVNSATQITATTPPHTAGAATVTVTTPSGTSDPDNPSAYFFYAASPSLATVAPSSGSTAGGATVTLTGNDLLGTTAVTFGGVAATSFTVNSATHITAVAPPHTAGAATVTVTTPGGTSNPVSYVYLTLPALLSLVPDRGPTHAGTVVTVTGTDLTTTTEVRFGSTPAAFTVVSPTQVTTVAPAGAGGPVGVTVTTAAGTSNPLTYVRVPAPGI
ncbi:hypothetical protein SALBM311S_10026 [Streptomyces alboniger]